MTLRIGVLGTEDFTIGFRLAGVSAALVAGPDDYEAKLSEALGRKDLGILVVESKDVDRLPAGVRRRVLDSIEPVVIQMGEASAADLREKVKNAIGIDLYKD